MQEGRPMSVTPVENFTEHELPFLVFIIANKDAFYSSIAHSLQLIAERFQVIVVFTQASTTRPAGREWRPSKNVKFLRRSTFGAVRHSVRYHLWWRELHLINSVQRATRGKKIVGVVTDNLHTCSALGVIHHLGINDRDVVLVLSVFRDFFDLLSRAANNRHVTGRSEGKDVDRNQFLSFARKFGPSSITRMNRTSQNLVLRLMRAPKRLGLMFWEFEDYLRLTSDFSNTRIVCSCPVYRILPPLLIERAQPCQFLEEYVTPLPSVDVVLLTMEADFAFLEAVRSYISKEGLESIIVRPHPRRRSRDTGSIVAYLSEQQGNLAVRVRVDETASIAELAARSRVLLAEYSSAAIWEALQSNPNLMVRGVWSDLDSRTSDPNPVELQDIDSDNDNKLIRSVSDCLIAREVSPTLDAILINIFLDRAHS